MDLGFDKSIERYAAAKGVEMFRGVNCTYLIK